MDVRHAYHGELQRLEREILAMGNVVRHAVEAAVSSLFENDDEAAARVIDEDSLVDTAQVAAEDRIVAILATEQPVAGDLRHLVTALKITTQLERIGDHALHIAKAALALGPRELGQIPAAIRVMSEAAVSMISSALAGYAGEGNPGALRLEQDDEVVDALRDEVVKAMVAEMRSLPERIEPCLTLLQVARELERIADHATNIGEWVVYGRTARHIELNP